LDSKYYLRLTQRRGALLPRTGIAGTLEPNEAFLRALSRPSQVLEPKSGFPLEKSVAIIKH